MNRLKSLSRSPNIPRFTYVYNIEYHYAQINSDTKEEQNGDKTPLDIQELCSTFKECYPNSLLCVLLMKKSFSDESVGGTFWVCLNRKEM